MGGAFDLKVILGHFIRFSSIYPAFTHVLKQITLTLDCIFHLLDSVTFDERLRYDPMLLLASDRGLGWGFGGGGGLGRGVFGGNGVAGGDQGRGPRPADQGEDHRRERQPGSRERTRSGDHPAAVRWGESAANAMWRGAWTLLSASLASPPVEAGGQECPRSSRARSPIRRLAI